MIGSDDCDVAVEVDLSAYSGVRRVEVNDDGWMFDWDQNAVVFYGEAIPSAGSTVDVAYDIEGGC